MALHVVHLVTSFDVGGLQNGIVNIINGSDPTRLRHTVVSMRDSIDLAVRLERGDVRVAGIETGRNLTAWRRIGVVFDELAPDIVHTRNWGTYPDGILAARRSGIRTRIHGFHGRNLENARGESFKRRIVGRLLGLATTRTVALTPSMKREYIRDFGVADARIEVIPNGIDLARLDGFAPDADLTSPFTVVTVGRLDPVKNLPLLIRAFAGMTRRGPDDRLVIVGGGPERDRLEALVRTLSVEDRVTLTGERTDAPSAMKAADVYVQPSFYEGMSNTIVEAMACGVPVIATDAGGNGDVAGRHGTARLVPSDDLAAMIAALDTWRDDPTARRRVAEAGRERVLELFGLERMVEAYSRLYESAFAGANPQGANGRRA